MKTISILVALIFSTILYGQSIGLDTSFDTDGKLFDTSISETPQAVFFEDNKYFFVFNNGFCSINYDGTTNTSFGVNGKLFFNNSSEGFVTKGAKFHNGYIYIFGQQMYSSSFANKNIFIAKISASGVFDTSFGTDGFMRFDSGVDLEIINDLTFNDDGKILAVGDRTNSVFVCKVNNNGTLDTSFNSTGFKSFPLASGESSIGVGIHNYMGDFLLVGSSTPISVSDVRYLIIMKMDGNGNLIGSYGNNGLRTIALSNQGDTGSYTMLNSKLIDNQLYCVYYYAWSFNNQHNRLVKYDLVSDSYSPICYLPFVLFDYTFDNNENIYITGTERCSPPTSSYCLRNYNLYKRNFVGDLDMSFNSNGTYTCNFFPNDLYSDDLSSILFRHEDGKILVAGRIYNPYSPPAVGTSGFTAIRVMDTTLSNDDLEKEVFSVFPNPSSDEISFSGLDNISISRIIIFNTYGQKVIEKAHTKTINVKDLAKGIYLIKIVASDKEYVSKFIKN